MKKGDSCLVSLYEDKSGRLCATMKVYPLLRTDSPYKKEDQVTGIVYDTSREFGVFVAVDDQYSARIPKKEVYGNLTVRNQSAGQSHRCEGRRKAGFECERPDSAADGKGCGQDLEKKWKNGAAAYRLPIRRIRSGSRQSWE